MLVCRCAHYELAKPDSIAYPLPGMQIVALSPEHYLLSHVVSAS